MMLNQALNNEATPWKNQELPQRPPPPYNTRVDFYRWVYCTIYPGTLVTAPTNLAENRLTLGPKNTPIFTKYIWLVTPTKLNAKVHSPNPTLGLVSRKSDIHTTPRPRTNLFRSCKHLSCSGDQTRISCVWAHHLCQLFVFLLLNRIKNKNESSHKSSV